MKNHNSRRIPIALVGCLVTALALPLSAETQPASVDRGHNRPNTSPRAYEPGRPVDRDNGTLRSANARAEFTRGDLRLVKKTAATSAYETVLSRQATTRASNADVRAYADAIVRDHEAMDRDLAAFTSGRGVMPPATEKYRDELDDLAQKTGTDYDEAYLDDMIDSHESGIRILEKAAESDNTELAAFAVQHLPTMRDHLARAKQLDEVVDD